MPRIKICHRELASQHRLVRQEHERAHLFLSQRLDLVRLLHRAHPRVILRL